MKHTNQISVTHTSTTPEVPLWQKITSWLLTFVMLFQITLPVTAQAATLISDSFIQSEVNANGQYERVSNSQYQFEKAYYVDDVASSATQNIATFHQKLLDFRKSALPSPLMIPIINDGITIILPHYPLAKQIGDPFVQSRFIRSQIFNALNRNLISKIYATEKIQINALYNNAYTFSGTSSAKLGDKLTQAQVNSFGKNLIWPELRSINGEQVLVPVVHFTDDRLNALKAEGHTVEFLGDEAHFNSITVNAGTIFTNRNTFINTAGDFNVNQKAKVVSSGDLNLLVGGTLQILSGQLTAQDSVNIIADQYVQKTLVHRFATRFEQGTRLGTIASVNAINGNVSIRSYNDIVVQGGTIDGDNIVLNADGNIMLLSQRTSYVRNENIGGFDETTSIVSHTASRLSASDSIYLMASGIIQINASTLTADSGVLQILAQQGIYITNEFDEFQKNRQGTVGEVTLTEQEFQTIAIQSALEAGKGVLIASDFGDITLRATEITSGDGTQINAYNGAVNLLLAKEQDHYFMNRVTEGMWRIKTETQTDTVDTAVYNRIIGGVKVQATHGVTLELGQSEDVTLDEMMAQFEDSDDLSWMAELYHDPELSQNVELAYQELVNIHEYDKTSSLSPAAMAVIAIAMAVAMGPAGFGVIGAGGHIAVSGFVGSGALTAALQAGALALATQTAVSHANGNNLIETAKAMHSSETVKTVAMAMATAGALNYIGSVGPFSAVEGAGEAARNMVDLGNQAAQLVVKSAVSTGISTVINGGNFDEFTDTFVQALQVNAVNQLGASLAEDIEFYSQHAVLDEVLEYIAHGAVGCLTGGLNSSDSGDGCAAGAAGSITATFVSKSFDHEVDTLTQEGENAAQWLKDNLNLDPNNKDQLAILKQYENYDLLSEQSISQLSEFRTTRLNLTQLRQQSVDISRLVAGLGAFIAGGTAEAINAAAQSAQNTGQSALWRPLKIPVKQALVLSELLNEHLVLEEALQRHYSLDELSSLGIVLPSQIYGDVASDTQLSPDTVIALIELAEVVKAVDSSTYIGEGKIFFIDFDEIYRKTLDGGPEEVMNALRATYAGLNEEIDDPILCSDPDSPIGCNNVDYLGEIRTTRDLIGTQLDNATYLQPAIESLEWLVSPIAAVMASYKALSHISVKTRERIAHRWKSGVTLSQKYRQFKDDLVEQTRKEAQALLDASSTNKNKKAYSIAGHSRSGLKSPGFTNIAGKPGKWSRLFDNDLAEFAEPFIDPSTGQEIQQFFIKPAKVDAFIDYIKDLYKQNENMNQEMHSTTERLLRNYVKENRVINSIDGVPGLHAEVRSANWMLNNLPANTPISHIQLSTQKLTVNPVTDFPACFNCNGILVGFDILTGVAIPR
ncbi:DUF637 domain-containing protein [uncultured Shewanella sp.]|uniref:DUF637 domain-containing protein n=1 Tax=uncultured Shewanella sp. TaxID=173975 RepID=UPI0026290A2A|nr:DUF637 domain-containing protein [uncultured Shewanella sp.]